LTTIVNRSFDQGLRPNAARLLLDAGDRSEAPIARVALAYDGHFEVGDLVDELRRAGIKDAHLATVYRTLPLLVEAGLIQQTLLSAGGRHFYEPAFERPHHDHLICIACGKVVEFEFEAFEVLQRDIATRYGFELTAHVHELLGRCHECRRTRKTEK
jgi:Fur family ferric uptake transcriptional regulator